MPGSVESGTVSIAFVREAVQALARRGLDAAPLLQQAGIEHAWLAHDEARVSAHSYGALWLAIATALDDELFGLDAGRMKVGSFATLTQLMLHTRTLREALQRGARLINLLLDEHRVELRVAGDEAQLCVVDVPGRDDADAAARRRFAHETLFVMLHGLACWLTSRRITVLRAAFAYARPPWWREYLSVYARALSFDSGCSALVMPTIELEAPVVQSERSAREFLRKAPANFIVKYKNPDSVASQVRRLLRNTAPEQWPDFEAVAAMLRMSPSTLRRRLVDEDQTFRTLKDALRRDLAVRYLQRSRMPLLDIAHALGFAEASAFHRAFRQWTGVSPGEYRRSGEAAP